MRTLRNWPRSIYVKQEGRGGGHADVYDGETHEKLTHVMSIRTIFMEHTGSVAEVTMVKYEDTLPAVSATPEEMEGSVVVQGVVCAVRQYALDQVELRGVVLQPDARAGGWL